MTASTSELAPILDAKRKQFPIHVLVPAIAGGIFAVALAYDVEVLGFSGLFIAIVAWPIAFAVDRQRRTTTLNYDLQDNQKDKFERLLNAFKGLQSCQRIWRIPSQWDQPDWKRNAGANSTVQRQTINLRLGLPSLLKCNLKFPSFQFAKQTIFFAPDAILIVERNSVAALHYPDADISAATTRFIEDEGAPSDAQVVDETWKYVNKKGGPDRRFSNNSRLPICLYGQLDFKWSGGLNARLQCSRPDKAAEFSACVAALRQGNSETVPGPSQPSHALTTNDVAVAYSGETARARALATDHGKLWEFLLVQELLNSRLPAFKTECDNLLNVKPTISYGAQAFVSWLIHEMKDDLSAAIAKITRSVKEDLLTAMGKPGVAGDAIQILTAVNAIFDAAGDILVFERKLREASPPTNLTSVRDSLNGIASSIAVDLYRFALAWGGALDALRQGSHEFKVTAVINSPPQLEHFSAELGRVTKTLAHEKE